ncbi:MAG: GWxTD domain-containing protein [Bacteroidota bacterium]
MLRALVLVAFLLSPAAAAQPHGQATAEPLAAARAAYAQGHLTDAVALAERALERDRRSAEAHHLLALAYGAPGPLRDERRARRHGTRAVEIEPDNVPYLETRLRQFQRELSEERAFSMTDGRRAALARRILALDAASALAHEEQALGYFLEFDWRRSLAARQGGWDRTAERGMSGAANRALRRTGSHIEQTLAAEPRRASAHRLALRTALTARDDAALLAAARRMKAARPADPDANLFLGLALHRAGETGAASRAVDAALGGMPEAQRLALESVARFVGADDEAAFAADSAAFTERFWQRRDPRLLTTENERRLEHVARLAAADLLFADPRRDRRGWASTKGEVAVRYGLPRAEATWLTNDIVGKDFSRYNRWAYPGFTLLFEDAFRDGDYAFWSSAAGEDEATRARSLMNRMPERFDYAPPDRVRFPFAAATFRGEGGATDVVVSYRTPSGREDLRAGAFLLDADGGIRAEQRTTGGTRHPEIGTLELSAAPGAYELAVEFETAGAVGFERAALDVPAYASGFGLSDLLPATVVEEDAGRAEVLRRGFQITPAPGATFAAGQPVYLYFEGYDLTPAEDGGGQYAVEVTLRPEDTAMGLVRLARRLLGERGRGVAVEFEGSSPDRSFGEYVVLDARRQAPGPYILTLRLRDLASGRAIERTTALFIE